MLATAPQLKNRITSHFAPTSKPVPATPDGKQAAWGEAVFAAMMFYQAQLVHPDERVAERAARAIFDLEKTRLRHGREVAGDVEPKLKKPDLLPPLPELPPHEETMRTPDPPTPTVERAEPERPKFTPKEMAVADTIIQMEKYRPLLDEMKTKLTGQGASDDESARLAVEALRGQVLDAILERRAKVAGSSAPSSESLSSIPSGRPLKSARFVAHGSNGAGGRM